MSLPSDAGELVLIGISRKAFSRKEERFIAFFFSSEGGRPLAITLGIYIEVCDTRKGHEEYTRWNGVSRSR